MTHGFIIFNVFGEALNEGCFWCRKAPGDEWVHTTIPDTRDWEEKPSTFQPAIYTIGGGTRAVAGPIDWRWP